MPNFNIPGLIQAEDDWKQTIVKRIDEGKVLPFISNVVCNDLIFESHSDLVQGFAESLQYPLTQNYDLPQIAQFYSVMRRADPKTKSDYIHVKEIYLTFLGEALSLVADKKALEDLKKDVNHNTMTLTDKAERLNRPSFEDFMNPFVRLAQFPLPIFLTTSYHSFLETALRKEGKTPRPEICYWNEELSGISSVLTTRSLLDPDKQYTPNPDEPLVYHLHGLDAYPQSLVLTEDDHLDFMATILKDKERIPLCVRQSLADSSLILFGYELSNWDFKVIFRSMIRATHGKLRRKSVAIQLSPNNLSVKKYLQNYLHLEAEFEVYWGEPKEFIQELWQDWAAQ